MQVCKFHSNQLGCLFEKSSHRVFTLIDHLFDGYLYFEGVGAGLPGHTGAKWEVDMYT